MDQTVAASFHTSIDTHNSRSVPRRSFSSGFTVGIKMKKVKTVDGRKGLSSGPVQNLAVESQSSTK